MCYNKFDQLLSNFLNRLFLDLIFYEMFGNPFQNTEIHNNLWDKSRI